MPPDRLFFYSGSADRPPGLGVHEAVAQPAAYAALAQVKQWRQRLSNFWGADFLLEGRTYQTVEHAFQAAKIALVAPDKALAFSLESGSELARGGGLAARKQRKLVLLSSDELARWDALKGGVVLAALRAKFGQHPDLREVLLATREAELWHGTGRGAPPARVVELETVRRELKGA